MGDFVGELVGDLVGFGVLVGGAVGSAVGCDERNEKNHVRAINKGMQLVRYINNNTKDDNIWLT